MKSRIIKIIEIILVIIIVSIIFSNITNAMSEIIGGADSFLSSGSVVNVDSNTLKKNSDIIYNILLSIGIVAAFIVGAYLGIKFMTSSVEGQADVKKALIPYIAGCIVVFGAFGIWKLVVTLASNAI